MRGVKLLHTARNCGIRRGILTDQHLRALVCGESWMLGGVRLDLQAQEHQWFLGRSKGIRDGTHVPGFS